MTHDRYEERRGLSFEQAEGAAPLPAQLKRTELPKALRAHVWVLFDNIIRTHTEYDGSFYVIREPWKKIVIDEFVFRQGGFVDRTTNQKRHVEPRLKDILQNGNYLKFYGLIQFILHHDKCPDYFSSAIGMVLTEQRSPYRVVGGDTLVPIASDEMATAVNSALEASNDRKTKGAHAHLRQAAIDLSSGNYANSVRESISSVESICRVLEPTADLSKALGRLEKSGHLHKAMKHGFGSLYGWTSDESGIRHALLEDGDAKVDEADALFMIGACASFVSYLIAKKQAAGIVDT